MTGPRDNGKGHWLNSVSEFALEKSLPVAFDTLADCRVLVLDERQWGDLSAMLDAPPTDNPRLRALLARKPAWEP